MANENSFIDMYRLLNLQPGCDLSEFKQAYRRRVAVLHPDRSGDSSHDSTHSEQLQQLTRLYAAAIVFERRHGRLPGATASRPSENALNGPAVPQAYTAPIRSRHSRLPLIGLLAVLIIVWLVWNSDWIPKDPAADSPTSSATSSNGRYSDPADEPSPLALNIGMNATAVRSIEGEPMLVHGHRWEYGPSWVRFENGTVVDWYSSPLNPLKAPSSHLLPTGN